MGGEWTRLQTKMKYLHHKNEQLDRYLASEREIEKLSKSLKESIKETFSSSSLMDEEDECGRAENATSQETPSSRASAYRAHARPTHSFDELALLKSFYVTLTHFRSNLFKRACLCGEQKSLDTTCIFCHMFKKYDRRTVAESAPNRAKPPLDATNYIR